MKKNNDNFAGVSLARVLSKLGYCSRSQAEVIIAANRVSVNGAPAQNAAQRIDMEKDRIAVDGIPLAKKKKFVYLLLNKPTGYITTRVDEKGRKTIYELLPATEHFVFPVGRLDKDSSGALIVTNDSQLGERLTNPDSLTPKSYRVHAEGVISDEDIRLLEAGVVINDGYTTLPASIREVTRLDGETDCTITITEGKNRQIRKMFASIGHPVITLHRVSIGTLDVGSLAPGTWRPLEEHEILNLLK